MNQPQTILSAPISCLFLDVGGTLWPEDWGNTDEELETQGRQIQQVLPNLPVHPVELGTKLQDRIIEYNLRSRMSGALTQAPCEIIRQTLSEYGLEMTDKVIADVRRAMRVSPVGRANLVPGAMELISNARDMGLRRIVVSNTGWRGAEDYEQDFEELGAGGLIEAFVTSADMGYRKPHPAMFKTALRIAECEPERCVMIGNSEPYDIVPARAIGMRTIRVVLDGPPPADSRADAVVTSLHEATGKIREWVTSNPVSAR